MDDEENPVKRQNLPVVPHWVRQVLNQLQAFNHINQSFTASAVKVYEWLDNFVIMYDCLEPLIYEVDRMWEKYKAEWLHYELNDSHTSEQVATTYHKAEG